MVMGHYNIENETPSLKDRVEDALDRAKEHNKWLVVTEADGSKASYKPTRLLNTYGQWIQWHSWHPDGHTVEETRVRAAATMRWPDVELMNDPPEECKPAGEYHEV
jgi:hypothetical protein